MTKQGTLGVNHNQASFLRGVVLGCFVRDTAIIEGL